MHSHFQKTNKKLIIASIHPFNPSPITLQSRSLYPPISPTLPSYLAHFAVKNGTF